MATLPELSINLPIPNRRGCCTSRQNSGPLFYADNPGQAKCIHCFIGGNFWDLRATGLRLQSPTAMQAEGSPLNPTEMANPDPACVVRRISERPYRGFFESIWGPRAFNITWPDDVDALCSRPNDNPGSAIGSEVPGPNTTPLVVKLSPADRARAQSTFDQMAEAIAAYEASPEVSPFSSKFDAYLAGSAELSEAERRGGQPAASIDGRMGWQMGRRSERDRKAPRRFA